MRRYLLARETSEQRTDSIVRLAQVALLLLAFALMVSSALKKSPTVDEQSHLFRGVAYLKTGATHFLLGHPLFGSTLAALPLLTEPDLRLPLDEPYWNDGNWSLAGDAFLWKLNENPQRLAFLGRLAVMWETLLLGAIAIRWGRQLAGSSAGLLAGALLLLDPNIMAHGRLVTNDMPITLFYAITIYGYWRWAREQRLSNLLLAGLGLGLAGASKYNAAFLLPILGVQALGLAWQWKQWKPVRALLLIFLAGAVVIWAVYGFAVRPLPGGAFWDDLFWTVDYFGRPHDSFLFGQVSPDGWWYYFPVVFLLKTPLPTLLLLLGAFFIFARKWVQDVSNGGRDSRSGQPSFHIPLFLLMPTALYGLVSLASSINIGYRYLLPLLPFLFLFIAVTVVKNRIRLVGWLTGLAVGFLLLEAIFIWPNYIPYFNLLAGGTTNGWRLLSDSNVDWGQDLPALAEWQGAHDETLKLSYFGMARPSAYGIEFEALPTWAPAPEQIDPARQPFNPADPAPGFYAISVTNLHGNVLGDDREAYTRFRDQTPLQTLGGSIFVYEVPARGKPTDVAFSGLRPADLSPQLHDQFQTNDVRVRWFDAESSYIWPQGGGWAAVPSDLSVEPTLVGFWPEQAVLETPTQSLYRLPLPPQIWWDSAGANVNGVVQFLGFKALESEANQVTLLTAWRVLQATDRPLKIFVHALDTGESIIGQWDGLHIDPGSWMSGDVFVQFHSFSIGQSSESQPAGEIRLFSGVYDGETNERLSDRIPLQN